MTVTMFLKALGYGLGLATTTTTTAVQAGDSVTALDNYVQYTPNKISGIIFGGDDYIGVYRLGGPVVNAVNGGPVPLVTPDSSYVEAFEHLGSTPTIAGSSDIFAVSQDITGESLQISRLDLAMMQEAGVPIIAGVLPCFAQGTRIATPRGAVAIERLQIGDTVLTISGAPQQITWIGRRHIDCRRHPDPDQVLPVRIAPHAFGQGRPGHAVLLSPDHAVFVEDVLIPIRFLVNRSTIARLAVETITYYHIELAQHDVVLAEGRRSKPILKPAGDMRSKTLTAPFSFTRILPRIRRLARWRGTACASRRFGRAAATRHCWMTAASSGVRGQSCSCRLLCWANAAAADGGALRRLRNRASGSRSSPDRGAATRDRWRSDPPRYNPSPPSSKIVCPVI
jgi:hypothetical protein